MLFALTVALDLFIKDVSMVLPVGSVAIFTILVNGIRIICFPMNLYLDEDSIGFIFFCFGNQWFFNCINRLSKRTVVASAS